MENAIFFYNKSWKGKIVSDLASIKILGIKKAEENMRYHSMLYKGDRDDTDMEEELNLEM